MHNHADVLSQLQLHGLVVDDLVVDGRVHRCPTAESPRERKGWYLLHEWEASNRRAYIVGTYGIWHGADKGAIKVALDKSLQMSRDELAAMKAAVAADRKRAQAQRDAQASRAAARAAVVWAKALTQPPEGGLADYLSRKAVRPYGLRYSPTGSLVIPIQDHLGDTKGLQFILPSHHPRKKKTGRDKEFWPAGLQMSGRWFQIGSPLASMVMLVAEGYATAATLHEALGLPVAVAFNANNLLPVAQELRKRHPGLRILICADDDYLQRCESCGKRTDVRQDQCTHCGHVHDVPLVNPGARAAAAAALAVDGAWVSPVFPGARDGQKLTDFNDLQHFPGGGLGLVRQQVERKLAELGWEDAAAATTPRGGAKNTAAGDDDAGGGDAAAQMPSRISIDEAARRYCGIYGMGGKVVFDFVARRIVHKDDVLNLLPSHGWEALKNHPHWQVVYDHQIGFDPSERDPAVVCNLFGGWPMKPQPGECGALLMLLEHMCANEPNAREVYEWILKWLAYPLQHPGAKMQSAVVVHGPQGTGKSRFFEAYAKIFGAYGRVLGQEALEDKFNADWAEKKLFILADEVLARSEMFHIKNRLKGFITGDTIRVNPKNMPAHNERNAMNIVFLSNELRPLVLEEDDRRHAVIWVPPKLDDMFFADVNIEIERGGAEALYDFLLKLAKHDLVQHSLSAEERFLADWQALEIETASGGVLPFCPCSGADLYREYERWCTQRGERARRAQELIGLCGKRHQWEAGKTQNTWVNLRDKTYKKRKMVVPSEAALQASLKTHPSSDQDRFQRERFQTKTDWLTLGYFAFQEASLCSDS